MTDDVECRYCDSEHAADPPSQFVMEQRCPHCDSIHTREGLTVRQWDGVTWEGYRKCAATEVPADTRWDFSEHSSHTHSVYFGGPATSTEPYRWGAPLRKVIPAKIGRVEYARYHRTRKAPKESHDD